MKKLILIIGCVFFLLIIGGSRVNAEEYIGDSPEQEISDEDFTGIMDSIVDNDLQDGEEIVVNDKYIIECEIKENSVIQPFSAYGINKSYTQTFYVTIAGTNTKAFTIAQTVAATINSTTNQVKITSYVVSITKHISDYHSTVIYSGNMNVYSSFCIGVGADIKLAGLGTSYYYKTYVTVFATGEYKFSAARI